MSVSLTPNSNRSTRNPSKCEDCGRLFRNNHVLGVHRAYKHTEKTNTALPSKNDNDKTTKPSKTTAKPDSKQKSGEKQAKSDDLKKRTQNDLDESKPEVETTYGSGMRSLKYKCPICSTLTFSSYLTAYKHIQKMHPVDKNGEVVDPSSPLIIKPIKSESCVHCDLIIEPNTTHTCDPSMNKSYPNYTVNHHCMGCSQTFETLKGFHNHIPSLHSDGLVSLFFTTEPEFLRWKKFMELQTRISYTKDAMFDNRRFFKCNVPVYSNKTVRKHCSSAIIVQTYDNGFQVHFYKKHYGHTGKTYKLQQEFQKNAVNKILNIPPPKEGFKETKAQPKPQPTPQPSKDLYLQLQSVMESILQTAAKLSEPHLKEFYEKAVELKMFLNTYKGPGSSDEDVSEAEANSHVKVVKRDMSNIVGAKILELLENSDDDKEEAQKRKIKSKDIDKVPAKRVRRAATMADTRKPLESKDTRKPLESKDTRKPLESKDTRKPLESKDTRKPLESKDTRKPLESKESVTNNTSRNIKASDEKIEEFAPKIVNTYSIKTDKKDFGISPMSDEKPVFIKSPTFSFNDTYKDFVEKNFDVSINTSTPAVKTYKPSKKVRIRTRLGMYKPENRNRSKSDDSLSPKAVSNNSSPKTAAVIKIESYEVKEQENDCNILILKI